MLRCAVRYERDMNINPRIVMVRSAVRYDRDMNMNPRIVTLRSAVRYDREMDITPRIVMVRSAGLYLTAHRNITIRGVISYRALYRYDPQLYIYVVIYFTILTSVELTFSNYIFNRHMKQSSKSNTSNTYARTNSMIVCQTPLFVKLYVWQMLPLVCFLTI